MYNDAMYNSYWSTGWWFGTWLLFSIGNFIIPTDELMFVRGVETTKLYWYIYTNISIPKCRDIP